MVIDRHWANVCVWNCLSNFDEVFCKLKTVNLYHIEGVKLMIATPLCAWVNAKFWYVLFSF